MRPELQVGMRFSWEYTIPERSTVPNLYHDTEFCRVMPNVLATGYLVGMMELACIHGLMPYVDWPQEQSVGTMVQFNHLAASAPGMTLRIEGELLEINGRRLLFQLSAWDNLEKISDGRHERVLIASDKFNAKMADKIAKLAQTSEGKTA